MKHVRTLLVCGITSLLFACSTGKSVESGSTVSNSPYAGKYIGEEILEGKSVAGGKFRLRININERGKVSVIDIDNRIATGYLEGSKFVAKRGGEAPQVFTGQIEGDKITGITTDNPYLGSGTFSAVRQ